MTRAATIDVVIPTYNEMHTLENSVRTLLRHLTDVPYACVITIADNASTDGTPQLADRLAEELPGVRAVHVSRKGRGLALKTAWSQSDADVLVYMDVDLSTSLNALLPLVAPLVSGHSDVATGTRLAPGARVWRGSKREVISRGYNLLLRSTLGTGVGDAQCGFKAIRADTARWLLPLVEDDAWFFDTELLVLAERAGLRIHQVPVDWVDDPDSRVDLWRTALDDLAGIRRLGWNLSRGRIPLLEKRPARSAVAPSLAKQLLRFLSVGVVSTIGYALVFLLARGHTSAVMANVLALVMTAMFNTSANRIWTFGIRGRARAVTHQAQGILVLALGLGVTTGALSLSNDLGAHGHRMELVVLTGANLVVTAGRFALFRTWVFRAPDLTLPKARRKSQPADPADFFEVVVHKGS